MVGFLEGFWAAGWQPTALKGLGAVGWQLTRPMVGLDSFRLPVGRLFEGFGGWQWFTHQVHQVQHHGPLGWPET